ncbi:TPA: hypothetical protein RNY37_001857 [Pasteurella multocida]|uniref:hypothetical protein n=1 Tax=Pasteurella multocida TaxID=747 RepID=UPI0028785572|nr:hypothetical protein [Pasteurella multocida]MEB3489386.1 hypothetical protein [Pasteurella multocida]MEB3503421.1 hypothetical protein [Pasteurella multocida]HDR1214405.1 hypothetical protein [Pasteurella multocida]HDX1193389.1 hypothetical protein [Pasteurella multocida]
MLDFEKAYAQLTDQRENNFISLYDLFLMIRSKHPNLSDNKIATVLIDKFKYYNQEYSNRPIFDDLLDENERECLKVLNQLGDLDCYTLPEKLHQPPNSLGFDSLIEILEAIEENGISENIPF